MDAMRKLEQFFKPGKGRIRALIITLALFFVLLGAAIYAFGRDEPSAAKYMEYDTKAGAYCYVEAVGLSDWVVKNDSTVFYTIEDDDGYFYMVRLSTARFNQLDELRQYWENEENGAEKPRPVRMYGIARAMTQDAAQASAEVWGLSEDEFYDIFTVNYLDVGATPGDTGGVVLLLIAIFTLPVVLTLVISVLAAKRRAAKAMGVLALSGKLEEAARSLDDPDTQTFAKEGIYMTPSYLLCRKGYALPYAEVLWAYKRIDRYNGIKVKTSLMLGTLHNKMLTLPFPFGKAGEEGIVQATAELMRRRPGLLVGYGGDNMATYKAMAKGQIPPPSMEEGPGQTPDNPGEGVNPQPSAEGANPQPSAEGANPQAPADGVNPQAPADSANPQPSAEGANPQPSADGVNPQAPAEGANPQAPADGVNPQAPAEGANPQAPAEGVNPQPSAEGANPPPAEPPAVPEGWEAPVQGDRRE